MSNRTLLSTIGGFLDLLGSAVAVSGAAEAKRSPRAADLRRLGIDPDQYRSIAKR